MRVFKICLILIFLIFFSCERVYDPIYVEDYTFYHPEFTDSENKKMNILIKEIPYNIKMEYSRKYQDWKETWDWAKFAACSNPRCWTESQQYEILVSFCKNVGKKLWPLIFRSYIITERKYLGSLLIEDLTLSEYGYLIDEIHKMIQADPEKYNSSILIYYIKEILKDL